MASLSFDISAGLVKQHNYHIDIMIIWESPELKQLPAN
jgi:hypothetical protein